MPPGVLRPLIANLPSSPPPPAVTTVSIFTSGFFSPRDPAKILTLCIFYGSPFTSLSCPVRFQLYPPLFPCPSVAFSPSDSLAVQVSFLFFFGRFAPLVLTLGPPVCPVSFLHGSRVFCPRTHFFGLCNFASLVPLFLVPLESMASFVSNAILRFFKFYLGDARPRDPGHWPFTSPVNLPSLLSAPLSLLSALSLNLLRLWFLAPFSNPGFVLSLRELNPHSPP